MTTTHLNNQPIAAGDFGSWLQQMRASLQGDVGTDVPCGDCVGCCVSSYFIPIRPTDIEARQAIPREILVASPGQSEHLMMGYRDNGTCPMLLECKCTIYAQRPQTCRDYDCRVFAAAGIDAGDESKWVINNRVRAWQFTYKDIHDQRVHAAIKAAAEFISTKRNAFPNGRAPTAPTGIAVLSIKCYAVFLQPDLQNLSEQAVANAIVRASREFDAPNA